MGNYKNRSTVAQKTTRRKTAANLNRKRGQKRPTKLRAIFPKNSWNERLVLWGVEAVGIFFVSGVALMYLLGLAARHFTGSDLIGSLLPFLLSVACICVVLSLGIILWWRMRARLTAFSVMAAPLLAITLTIGAGIVVTQGPFHRAYSQFRLMIGGKDEANRVNLAHQVYAAYRRLNRSELMKIADRSAPFSDDIKQAAKAYSLDSDLLFGLAAAESSFFPRDSKDGGVGLFQLTSVPQKVEKQVAKILKGETLVAGNDRYNTFAAAATLKQYLSEMGDDPLLGILAYNIGPANGGLRFIMEQYKASDFISIQPYLQSGPRNYPVRVLSYALAFRIWHEHGKFIPYEIGSNALLIQRVAIPGMDDF